MKRYTEEERAAARSIIKTINFEDRGNIQRAAEGAYLRKEFPERTLSSIGSLLCQERETLLTERKREAELLAAKEAKEAEEYTEEQVQFFATVKISEQMLREKHEAEQAVFMLKRAIIDDALGCTDRGGLRINIASIIGTAKRLWPDEYEAKYEELYY